MTRAVHEAIEAHAENTPTRVALRFLRNNGNEIDEIDYGSLNSRMRGFGSRLITDGLCGKRVVIACNSSIEYVIGMLGCFFAGAIAVPYMPVKHRMRKAFGQLAVDANIEAMVVDSDKESAGLQLMLSEIGLPQTKIYDFSSETHLVGGEGCATDLDSTAYIQYTSGSTSRPKGVLISHANLAANVHMIGDAFAQDETSSWLGWLPLYHDMGLVSTIMLPILLGIPGTFMAPMDFFQNPLLWIKSISKYKATTSGGPNFGFDLCTRAYESAQLEDVDLSSWSVAFNGAESVSRSTMDNFARAYKAHGFSYSAFKPCYGLAEATLVVSAVRRNQESQSSTGPDGQTRLCVGAPVAPTKVLLRDASEGTLFDTRRKIGEICISGPSTTKGYWGNTSGEGTFQRQDNKLFLRTGDLGYFEDDQLVICGRLKELIIIRGRNFYPQDIEHSTLEFKNVLDCAAFSVEGNDTEEIVLVVEIHRHAKQELIESLSSSLRNHIREKLDLSVNHIVTVRERSIPRTTSGKIQRVALREQYLSRALKVLYSDSITEELNTTCIESPDAVLSELIAQYIGRPLLQDDLQRTLVELGFDSLGIVRLSATLRKRVGRIVPSRLLHQGTPISQLQEFLLLSPASELGNEKSYSLSQGQRALTLLQAALPSSTRFTIARALALPLCRDRNSVKDRIKKLVHSIPMTRARFTAGYGSEDVVSFDLIPTITEEYFSEISEAKNWIEARCAQPFDHFSAASLVDVALIWSNQSTIVLVRAHHLVSDLTSIELLLKAIARAFGEGQFETVIGLAPGRAFQRELRVDGADGEFTETLRRFLASPLDFVDLCKDQNRLHLSSRGASRITRLPSELQDALPTLCRTYGTTEYVVLASIFLATIRQWTGKKDVIAGTPVDTRENEEDFTAFDNYANLTVLRGLVVDGISFATLIKQTKEFVTALSGYRNIPYSRLVESLQPVRKPGASPLFEVIFAAHRCPSEGHANLMFDADQELIELEGITATTIACKVPDVPFDLRFDVACAPTGLLAKIEYRTEVEACYSIEEFLRIYSKLSRLLAINPQDTSIAGMQQVSTIQGPTIEVSSKNIAHDITSNCYQFHDSVAVVDAAGSHSYGELLQRSAEVASKLIELGVQPETAVAVYLPREFDLVAAMLGVLRAGCCYVPIPDFTSDSRALRLRELSSAATLIDSSFMRELRNPPILSTTIDSRLAYRIFTSGSTGVPKCVEVSQSGLRNLLFAMSSELKISRDDVFAATTSIGFDIAGLEIWLPLLTGCRIAIFQTHELLDGRQFGTLLEKNNVTLLQGTPSLYSNLLSSGWRGHKNLSILCGGERLDWTLADQLLECGQSLWNVYGPTETTIWSSAYKVVREANTIRTGSVPIGRPLANTEFCVLDARMNHVSNGEDGDLWIGGAGLANGYFSDPALTSASFLSAETSPLAKRIYKTGDRARIGRSGDIEFLGRLDRQIKIKGHRLELAEVETYLLTLKNVRQAVALTSNSKASLEIWAALVPISIAEAKDTDAALRQHLREIAPEHAIPTRFLWLSDLPLNQNGKICVESIRKVISETQRVENLIFVGSELETKIADSWREVLGVAIDNAEYTFFDYGGTSLQLNKVKQALETRTGMAVDLLDLLHAGTIRQLASRLQNVSRSTHKTRNVAAAMAAIRHRQRIMRPET